MSSRRGPSHATQIASEVLLAKEQNAQSHVVDAWPSSAPLSSPLVLPPLLSLWSMSTALSARAN